MGQYLFLEDGRRVDVEDGHVTLFPDGGFRFRDAIHLGDIDRTPGGWALRRHGRDLGVAPSRRAAVARLLEETAEEIATHEQQRQRESAAHAEAGDYVRQFLPAYAGDHVLPPYLVFSAEDLTRLLDAVEESALYDDEDLAEASETGTAEGDAPAWTSELPQPTFEQMVAAVREILGIDVEDDPEELAQLAALGIVVAAWRNTHLENLHAGSHPSGGFPDTDMMRYNIATSRAVAEHVSPAGIDWGALYGLFTDPDRPLPGGTTVRELAGDELHELLRDALTELWTMQSTERDEGRASLYMRLAMRAAMYARDWYGTPWWPDIVESFLDLLADPASDAWRYDEGTSAEPASVASREALRGTLLERPEELDDAGINWCERHGLAFDAPGRGYARWRRRREPDWDPGRRPSSAA